MTARDKEELGQLFREELQRNGVCPLGFRAETARELITLAETWRSCRRYLLAGLVTMTIGALLGALGAGIRQLLR